MKTRLLGIVAAAFALSASGQAESIVGLRPVLFREVQVRDAFWAPRQETNRIATIPTNFRNLERAGNLSNLRLAGEGATNGFTGLVFMDCQVYKALEAASFSLGIHPDPVLEAKVDRIIGLLAKAQQPDGYLNSYYTRNPAADLSTSGTTTSCTAPGT